ncbi:PREDICTED: uncharacterized protein LOC104595616 isoform X2 [Nelumbo nucifera]|uniref:Uncharacterized protein LOC104595616 isoform X2 n=1 Tax=Nelumbo nucifera TaxID=4432 RepID=A0A1U8A0Y8_NELNU|nr:PREDICTED: uncharacterized protein LOC104595616 isoform X2 [Nelumbo nucifera]
MNCLLYVSSAAIFSKTNFIMKRSFYAFCSSSWKRSINHAGIKAVNLDFVLTRFRVQCYSSRRGSGGGRASPSSKPNPGPSSMGEDEKDAFYVVRKGDIVGVYKTLSDCQAQVGSSVCDPSVSVYKGYSLPKEAEEYLVAHGLKNAMYSISAEDVKGDLFGALVPCPFQQPVSPKGKTSKKDSPQKRSHEALELDSNVVGIGSTSVMSDPLWKHAKLEHSVEAQGISKILSCILEFDGASKGNPGKAGAGAVLRAEDGSVICRLREGVGIATNNVAEYRAMLLGLKYAIKKGFKRIRVQGDSKLVCMQVQGLWKAKNQNMLDLLKEAKELKDKFFSFEISHVLRDLNSDADAQANLAVNLEDGEVQVE